ncbi:hypothetical protein FHL15_009510 [Xylaria flabelliformis]|uniref:Uncharacterized protein n=1 Tax=Xylaria flabelliformis TaxID=2512241 RepID=A0A553HNQ2_9PEZI|nr:hypothetical protein FHL15_009510 [Xylaria flabelliformis]
MPGENLFRQGVRLMLLAAVIAGGLVSVALASGVTKDGVVESDKMNHEVEPYYNGHSIFKKQGPYIYGENISYPNITFTPATLTITLKTTSVTTETVVPQVAIVNSTTGTGYRPSLTGFTPKPTATIHVTPFNTIHAHTVIGSLNYTLTSSTVDAQTNSVASTNDIRSSAIASNDTVDSVFKCTHTPILTKQSSTIEASEFTTTILYSVSDGEEYTSTETVTVTPHVTIIRSTTITLPPDAKTTTIDSTVTQIDSSLGVVTVTVYVSEVLTEAQTGAVGISVSAYHVTAPKPVTTTVVQTVYPVPSSVSTTTCTESDMTKTRSVVSASHSLITIAGALPTLTVTVSVESLSSSTDASILTETSTATTTVTSGVAAASASVDTTCTTSTAGNPTATTVTTSSASHTRHQMSDSSYSSVGLINSTVGTVVVSSAHVTAQSITRYTALTHMPSANSTGGAITTYPVSSGAGSDEKPPCSVPWGGNDGGGSRSCVVMLAVVISLGLQGFVM